LVAHLSAGNGRVAAAHVQEMLPSQVGILSTPISTHNRPSSLASVNPRVAMSAPFCRNLMSRRAINVAYVYMHRL